MIQRDIKDEFGFDGLFIDHNDLARELHQAIDLYNNL
jgi:hypothetical protein